MSSIFDKIKTMVSASLRGTRPSKHIKETPSENTSRPSPVPEITDAAQDREGLPEVMDAPLTSTRESRTLSSPTPRIGFQSQVAEKQRDPAVDGDLEDERIVDLLKDNDTSSHT